MSKYCQGLIMALGLTLLTGCHTMSNGMDLFQSPASDASITHAVKEEIRHTAMLPASKIHVETMNHVVVLSGRVKSIRQSDMAGEIARKTPGVTSVQNNIIVRK